MSFDKVIEVGIFDQSVVDYAVFLEFGDKGNDFLRSAYDEHQFEISDYVEKQYRTIVDLMLRKKPYNIKKFRENIGKFIVKIIKNKIKSKGLVDSGKMLESVEYRI